MIQIWQPEHGATITRFAFLPAHGRRPPVPQNREYGTRRTNCNFDLGAGRLRIVSAIACSRQLTQLRIIGLMRNTLAVLMGLGVITLSCVQGTTPQAVWSLLNFRSIFKP